MAHYLHAVEMMTILLSKVCVPIKYLVRTISAVDYFTVSREGIAFYCFLSSVYLKPGVRIVVMGLNWSLRIFRILQQQLALEGGEGEGRCK